MKIELNRIAIWQPVLIEGISVNPHPRGTLYLEKDNEEEQVSHEPLYRYVKNYETEGIRFSLIVRSMNNNTKQVEKQLDDIAKELDKSLILEALSTATMSYFTYTNNYLKEDK